MRLSEIPRIANGVGDYFYNLTPSAIQINRSASNVQIVLNTIRKFRSLI